jgi:hypothetical protein
LAGREAQVREFNRIKGIGFRDAKGGEIVINPARDLIKNLDKVPLPAYDLVDSDKYPNLLAYSDHSVTLMTSIKDLVFIMARHNFE